MKRMPFSWITDVQRECKKPMKLYGYRSFDTMAKMRLSPVLDEIPLHDDLMGVLWVGIRKTMSQNILNVFIVQKLKAIDKRILGKK